jgi:hypothetical protein
MTTNQKTFAWPSLFGFERRGQKLAPRYIFAKRLAVNIGIALVVVLVSLSVGMLGYHRFEGLDWLRSFSHAAMILGGMGPYEEPKSNSGELFEGFYALYSGLLLVGVTGLILSPVFHRVMHQFHLPDDDEAEKSKRSSSANTRSVKRDSANQKTPKPAAKRGSATK